MDAKVFILPRFGIDTRRRQQKLARVDKILPRPVAFEGMPFGVRFKSEISQVIGHVIGMAILPGFAVDRRRYERPDIMAAAQDILAGFDAHLHTVHPHLAASRTGMDFSIDGNRGEHGIKRTSRRIRHEGVVESLVVAVA